LKISILGSGNVGSVLARRFAETGHEVTVANTSTSPGQAAAQVAEADLTVLAIPFGAVPSLDEQVKAAMAGKVVIDVTNPQSPDFMSLTVGHTTSGGEQVAAILAGATVVKAFNTVFAAQMGDPLVTGASLFLPVVGDDEAAKKLVIDLAAGLGFDAVDAGPLANARYTEPAVELLVHLAFGRGLGTGIGWALARA
jgi:8-hydroxy-5-deazaflavin:NADPH oxidoreductase